MKKGEPSVQNPASPLLLGSEPIPKLLWRYALPAVIAMISTSVFNIVDSVFIGHGVGPMAISGLAISLPLMVLSAAFGSMVGLGAAANMSIRLGQNDRGSAQDILGNVVLLNTIIGAAYALIVWSFLDPILVFFSASDVTLPYAREFMRVLLCGNVFTHLYLGLNDLLRASGYPKKAMMIMLAAVACNFILNPLFIFGFGWGIAGSAAATVISQIVAVSLEMAHFANKKHFIHFQRGIFRLKARIVRAIVSIGLAPFLLNVCSSVVIIFINSALKTNGGDLYIGAYGILNRLLLFFWMMIAGLTMGMQPIIGYNYGARRYDRVRQVLKLGFIVATCITATGFVIGQFFPESATRMFTNDPELTLISSRAMRIVTIFFPIVGFQIVISNFFQAIGKAQKAIFLSLTRQLFFLLPLLAVLPIRWGADGVWMSMPIADAGSVILAAFLLGRQMKKFRREEAGLVGNA